MELSIKRFLRIIGYETDTQYIPNASGTNDAYMVLSAENGTTPGMDTHLEVYQIYFAQKMTMN